jgi:hypothetical protein
MIFKVSEKFKGSCVLGTLNRPIWAGVELSIGGNDLYAVDVKAAIKKGILVPVDEKYTKKMEKTSDHIKIINKTNSTVILGEIVLGPFVSRLISKEERNIPSLLTAEENNVIKIISDKNEEVEEVEEVEIEENDNEIINKEEEKTKEEDLNKKVEYVVPETGEDKEVEPVVWNFKSKKAEKAITVPKTEGLIEIDEDENKVDFIDKEKNKTKKVIKKRKYSKKKKSTKKIATKKKVKSKKKKNVKTIQTVGEEKVNKTAADIAIELDSRGNPIGDKPSDTLKHLIESITPEDIQFTDQEQNQERHNKRTDMD